MTTVSDVNGPKGELIELGSMNSYSRKTVPPLKVNGEII
jgi:hypothetical protein